MQCFWFNCLISPVIIGLGDSGLLNIQELQRGSTERWRPSKLRRMQSICPPFNKHGLKSCYFMPNSRLPKRQKEQQKVEVQHVVILVGPYAARFLQNSATENVWNLLQAHQSEIWKRKPIIATQMSAEQKCLLSFREKPMKSLMALRWWQEDTMTGRLILASSSTQQLQTWRIK